VQVILKPDPGNAQELYLGSLAALGIDTRAHDVRFVEDNWESPVLGAWGLGWEVWLDGMEVTQFTYFQQVRSPPQSSPHATARVSFLDTTIRSHLSRPEPLPMASAQPTIAPPVVVDTTEPDGSAATSVGAAARSYGRWGATGRPRRGPRCCRYRRWRSRTG
jgi:hypothetical protein